MGLIRVLGVLVVVLGLGFHVWAAPVETLKIKFKISARDLPDKDDIGTSDPYAEILYTEDNKKDEVKLGSTSTLTDNENPDWGEIIEFDFVRSKKQRFILRLYDEDNLREDDKLGQAYVDVADFVDKGQQLTVNLNKKGYVILESVVPVGTPTPWPPTTTVFEQTHTTPIPFRSPQTLRFILSAKDLPNKDKSGSSDPFVDVFYTEGGSSRQKKVGATAVIKDTLNPVWKDVMEFQYDPSKGQKWFFHVRDSDERDDHDGIGEGWIDVSEYLSKGQKVTINLNKRGNLTIEDARINTTPTPRSVTTPSPQIRKLRFMLYIRNVEDKDILGTSDPYVKVYTQKDKGQELFIGNTQKFQDKESVDFPDVFEFLYDPSIKSKFRFLVLDEDDNRIDDELGNVSCDVADYVKSGENLTLDLPKGTITVIKAT